MTEYLPYTRVAILTLTHTYMCLYICVYNIKNSNYVGCLLLDVKDMPVHWTNISCRYYQYLCCIKERSSFKLLICLIGENATDFEQYSSTGVSGLVPAGPASERALPSSSLMQFIAHALMRLYQQISHTGCTKLAYILYAAIF